MFALRDYQIESVEDIRAGFQSGLRRLLLVSPTGSGKTILFSYISAGVAQKKKRVVLLAHRDELLTQISAALRGWGVGHGVMRGGSRGIPHNQVVVASVFTLARRLDHFPPPDLIVVDEAHHCVDKTSWGKVIAHFPNAKVLGVTATPCRYDGTGLGERFDRLIIGPSVSDLTAKGHLAPAEVYAPPQQLDMSGVRKRGGDYASDQLSRVVDRPVITGNAVAHYTKFARFRPAIAFCCSIEHANHVAERFRLAGYKSMSIDGKMSLEDRAQAIARLASGEIHVLTSCDVISEGLDVPRVECGIFLRPTQSTGLWLQQAGRVLRPAPGKKAAILLDHAGNSLRHGLPDDAREWSLNGLAPTGGGGGEDQVRNCPKCMAVHRPAPKCPRCGHVYKAKPRFVAEVAGELSLVQRQAAQAAAKKEVSEATDEAALMKIAMERGYNPGWVHHVMLSRRRKRVRPPIHNTSTTAQLMGDEPT